MDSRRVSLGSKITFMESKDKDVFPRNAQWGIFFMKVEFDLLPFKKQTINILILTIVFISCGNG